MARRTKATQKRHAPNNRPLRLGTHWRADGAPKVSYGSAGEAWSVADERRQETGVALNVYQCDVCAGWHMGRDRDDR
jgi:hypothetical protein